MPRPPILPTIDWKTIYRNGKPWSQWIAGGEDAGRVRMMKDMLKTLELPAHVAAAVAAVPRKVHVVAFAEDWCGDVNRNVPVLEKLAKCGGNLNVRYVARADAPEAFARHLTNGGEAVPKFVFLSNKFVECGNWGPMPAAFREWIARGKACGDVASARARVKLMYSVDQERGQVIRELMELIDIAATESIPPLGE